MKLANSNLTYKILVIEDNIADFDLIEEFLSRNKDFNYELKHKDKLSTAYKILEKEKFDIILLDLCLSDSTGFETFKNLYSVYPEIPIIVLSGLNENKISLDCVKNGAQDYLTKGDFHKNLLSRSISYSIERKNLENKIKMINENLEALVKERTKELDETNITLRNVLKSIQNENDINLENIVLNIEKNIMPLISSLKKADKYNSQTLKMLEENINNINSGFHKRLINFKYGLTPMEIKICKLVKSGYLAKEIAEILFVAPTTINEHKSNIRKKLCIKDSSVNLKIYLDELSPD